MTLHTVGGVAQAGQSPMQVVPLDVPIEITARFEPLMASKLRSGLLVRVHFTALQRVYAHRHGHGEHGVGGSAAR